jgi:hypothetical protein
MSEVNDGLLQQTSPITTNWQLLIAGVMAAYQTRNRLTDAQLAAFLGCDLRELAQLARCPRPIPFTANFQAEVTRLATEIGCDRSKLVQLLRLIT